MDLTCVEAVIGLKVNLCKSKVVPICNVDNMADLTSILGCKVGNLPMTYLGMPFGVSFKVTSM